MSIFLGNIQFKQVHDKLGYELTDEDKKIWDKYHCDNASLLGKESCFHVFDIPRVINVKGVVARDAIMQMFTSDKLTNPCGKFSVNVIE